MKWVIILMLLTVSGCNVFLGLDSVELPGDAPMNTTTGPNNSPVMCSRTCTCDRDCEVDCSGCNITCAEEASCSGALAGGSANCAADATCTLGCTDDSCVFACTNRGSRCNIDCGNAADCLLDCGTNRNGPQRGRCVFENCQSPTSCGDGIFVCNRDCPVMNEQ